MKDMNIEEYKKLVEQISQKLLNVMASAAAGESQADFEIPEGVESLSELAVGLEYLFEDLGDRVSDLPSPNAAPDQEQLLLERINQLEETINQLQSAPPPPQAPPQEAQWEQVSASLEIDTRPLVTPEIQRDIAISMEGFGAAPEEWLPGMSQAVQKAETVQTTNGQQDQALAVPINLHGEVIGVLGFDSEEAENWSEEDIATVEAVVEQVGLALEARHLFDQTQTALTETDALYQASAEINTASAFDDILNVLREHTALGENSHLIALFLFDHTYSPNHLPEWGLVMARWQEEEGEFTPRFPITETFFEKGILLQDRPTFIEDILQDPRVDEITRNVFVNQLGAKSTIFVPLVVGGQWLGYVNAFYKQTTVFPEAEIRRMTTLVSQAAVATESLRNVELAEQRAQEAQQRSKELALINRVVSAVAATLDLSDSLHIVADELSQAASAGEVSISLLNEDRSALSVIADHSQIASRESAVGREMPVRHNPAIQQVINTQKLLEIEDVQNNILTEAIADLTRERGYQTMIMLPLITGGEVIGIVAIAKLDTHASFSIDEMRLSETIVIQASTAIQSARLFEQTEAALTETANLYQASGELNAAQTFQDVLTVLRTYTILGQNARHVLVSAFDTPWVGDDTPERLSPLARWSHIDSGEEISDLRFNLREWPNVKLLLWSDRPTIIESIADDPRMDQATRALFMGKFNANSVLFTPLVVAGRWIGHIIATYQQTTSFPEKEIRRLMGLANQAAVTVQTIRLLEETTRRASQLQTAAEIARDSSSTLAFETLLNRAVNLVKERFGYYHASIFLQDGTWSVVRASTGEAGAEMIRTEHKLPIEPEAPKSVIWMVHNTDQPFVVNNVAQDPNHRPHPLLPDTQAEMAVPLKIGDRVMGALDVQSSEIDAFSLDDVAVLQILADQIAVAVDNARSFEITQQAMEEIRELDRLKSQFLANMSHELRTPLNSIIGFSRVILKGIDGPINETQQQDLEAIHSSGQHLLNMINDILDLSKVEAGKMELAIEEVELNDIIMGVMSTATGLIKETSITLTHDIPADLPTVYADRTRVRQVLLNLLQNATKFTEDGNIHVEGRAQEGPEGSPEVVISVTDSGIGIAQEDQEALFEPFSQVDTSPTRKTGGSGLGLSISRHLIEMQGGRIDLISEIGEGSTFYFTLPVAGPVQVAEEPVQDEAIIETNETQETIQSKPQGKIVLAVDDDVQVISLYERYLKPHGYTVISLTDPANAVEKALELRPFAITLDIMMPEHDGWDVIQALKAHPETQNIPVIICSIVEDREKGFNLGATDYLVKPILENELVNAVERLNADGSINDILVIDDDPNDLRLVEKILVNTGNYQVRLAEGGLKGLTEIRDHPPQAIILDLFMPNLDGFSLLETLRTDPELSQIPVIILSGGELTAEQKQSLKDFGQEMLSKGSTSEQQILESLQQALERYENLSKE